jgi:hypothetical protein
MLLLSQRLAQASHGPCNVTVMDDKQAWSLATSDAIARQLVLDLCGCLEGCLLACTYGR